MTQLQTDKDLQKQRDQELLQKLAYKFSNMASEEIPNILHTHTLKDFLKIKYECNSFGIENIKKGYYKLHGRKFDLTQFLRRYLYKKNGERTEVYAPNKTLLRKCVLGKIDEIITR